MYLYKQAGTADAWAGPGFPQPASQDLHIEKVPVFLLCGMEFVEWLQGGKYRQRTSCLFTGCNLSPLLTEKQQGASSEQSQLHGRPFIPGTIKH